MASEYASAGKPAIFLEQHVDFPMGKRIGRWWAAYNSTAPAYLPLVMVDSGHRRRIHRGTPLPRPGGGASFHAGRVFILDSLRSYTAQSRAG